ncbi:MAG: hypothetical protein K6F94_07175 [Bacteroidaceae bacterium]|nr:hypothetical protein [Bacteroidaceae bacterium]
MKKTYMIPALNVRKISLENMIAVSGPGTSSTAADTQYGMDTKVERPNSYNVWDDDWSKY